METLAIEGRRAVDKARKMERRNRRADKTAARHAFGGLV